jgi:tRNA (mo5U34)-methyltransferase
MDADRETLRKAVTELEWYHTIDLGGGIVTPGAFDLRPVVGQLGIPDRLDGRHVLDVGPGDGFFSFLFESRGAASVTTVELPSWRAHDASPVLQAFYASEPAASPNIHDALGLAARALQSKVRRTFVSIYDFDPAVHGTYDIVFCASVLLHLTDPLRALFAVRSVTRESAIIVTTIRRGLMQRRPAASFLGGPEGQVFWMPNLAALEQWCLTAGFARCERLAPFRIPSQRDGYNDLQRVVRAWVT